MIFNSRTIPNRARSYLLLYVVHRILQEFVDHIEGIYGEKHKQESLKKYRKNFPGWGNMLPLNVQNTGIKETVAFNHGYSSNTFSFPVMILTVLSIIPMIYPPIPYSNLDGVCPLRICDVFILSSNGRVGIFIAACQELGVLHTIIMNFNECFFEVFLFFMSHLPV